MFDNRLQPVAVPPDPASTPPTTVIVLAKAGGGRMSSSCGFDGECCDGVEAADTRVSSRRVVVARFSSTPDVDYFVRDEFGDLEDERPSGPFGASPLPADG